MDSPDYNEFYCRHAMDHYAGWKFNIAGSTWFHSLARSGLNGPPSPEEADNLRSLAPFANRASLVARQLRETRVQGMVDGLAAAGLSALIIDQDGRVGLATPGSERLFGDTFGVKQRMLWTTDLQAQANLNLLSQIARRRASTELIPNVVIRRRDGRRPILIQTVPVRGVGLDVLPGARLLAILIDLNADGSAPNQQLRQLFGLSLAEAQVAALLAEGSSVAEIAVARGVEEITVRGQLKALYRKLDANRQSDVVRLVERLRPTMGHISRLR